MDGIGRWHGLVIDCPQPRELASFDEGLLGTVGVQDENDWVVIGDAADRPGLAFQRSAGYERPQWPDEASDQQRHVDVLVTNLNEADAAVLARGATRVGGDGDGPGAFWSP